MVGKSYLILETILKCKDFFAGFTNRVSRVFLLERQKWEYSNAGRAQFDYALVGNEPHHFGAEKVPKGKRW